MYAAAMAAWTAPAGGNGAAASSSSAAPEIPTGPFVCSHCAFELTPQKNLKCGVCDMPRPGAEHLISSTAEEEEEMPMSKSASTRSSAVSKAKAATAPTANSATASSSAVAKPATATVPKTSARLLLVSGKGLSNIIPTLVAQISRVTNVQNFNLDGNVDHVKRTRDAIVKRLREGNSCIVMDSAVSYERQQAWITIASRCGADCDVLVGTHVDLLCDGFVHQFLPPYKYELIREAFASSLSNKSATSSTTTMSATTSISSAPSTGSTNSGSNYFKSSMEKPSSAVSSLSATKKTALAPTIDPIDLTSDDE